MEGKLYYAIAVFYGDDPTLYWLNYGQDATALSADVSFVYNNISKYTEMRSAEQFVIDLSMAHVKQNFMAELEGLLLKKIKLLGKLQPTTDDELHLTFRDDVKMQVYKVMINTVGHIVIKEPTDFVKPIKWLSHKPEEIPMAISA